MVRADGGCVGEKKKCAGRLSENHRKRKRKMKEKKRASREEVLERGAAEEEEGRSQEEKLGGRGWVLNPRTGARGCWLRGRWSPSWAAAAAHLAGGRWRRGAGPVLLRDVGVLGFSFGGSRW